MKQSAVQWLAIRYHHRQGHLSLEDIEKAKEMEKEQINKACFEGYYTLLEKYTYNYYNETFNNENNTQNQ